MNELVCFLRSGLSSVSWLMLPFGIIPLYLKSDEEKLWVV